MSYEHRLPQAIVRHRAVRAGGLQLEASFRGGFKRPRKSKLLTLATDLQLALAPPTVVEDEEVVDLEEESGERDVCARDVEEVFRGNVVDESESNERSGWWVRGRRR